LNRVLFTGGGTGGHVFPAIAVAERVREKEPEAAILFIGTKGKIEAKAVPEAGFTFKSIWISGFSRKSIKDNLLFPLKLVVSTLQSIGICMKFKPQVVVATGGYVSGPAVTGAKVMGAKVLLIEPNSYPGITTRLLERKAEEIHLMFEDAARYLRDKKKVLITGNPVRKSINEDDSATAREKLGIKGANKVVFVVGGSLGAKGINKGIEHSLNELEREGVTILWQTGKLLYDHYSPLSSEKVKVLSFIENINDYYAAADLVVARAGATTIAELSYLNKPAVLVPLPFSAEDHQLKNAKSMENAGAAVVVEEKNIEKELLPVILSLLNDEGKRAEMINNLKKLGGKDAAEVIAGRVIAACKFGNFS